MVLILIAVICYSFFIIGILIGIVRLSGFRSPGRQVYPDVSVIVPYRNESNRIKPLLDSFGHLNYPLEKLRFIFINDHSEDNSPELIQSFSQRNRFSCVLLDLPEGLRGKKAALEMGLIHADGEFILFTDADCMVQPNWITGMTGCARGRHADMVLGPVEMQGRGFAGRFQQSEFLSLQAVTMGTAGYGKAVLSNAANMLVRTDVLKSLDDPFQRDISSGDDVFLMEKIKALPGNVLFNLHPQALVRTPASVNWKELFIQRARWLSKTKKYPLNFSLMIAGMFGFLQFVYLLGLGYLVISGNWLILPLFAFHKLVFDIMVISYAAIKSGSKIPVMHTILLSLFYPLWTIISSLSAFIIKPVWKGRQVKV